MTVVNQIDDALLLNMSVNPSADMAIKIQLTIVRGSESIYKNVFMADAQANKWNSFISTLNLPSEASGADSIRLAVSSDVTDSFILDHILLDIPGDWKQEANQRIEEIRKRDVKILLNTENSDLVFEIRQLTHAFPFGTAINSELIAECQTSGVESAYCKFTRENYNWVVDLWRMKWKYMEPKQGEIVTEPQDSMINWAISNGLTVRSHALLWAKEENNPAWLNNLSQDEFINAVYNRVDFAVNWTEGKSFMWDVINEMVDQPAGAHNYFLDKSGDPDIRNKIFKRVKELAPENKYFVNDYSVVNDLYGRFALYQQQIRDLLAGGSPIDGIGLQSHLKDNRVDAIGYKMRVEELWNEFNIPLWVTEFDWNAKGEIDDGDHTVHAEFVEDFYRLMFSLEGIEGIMMWGFMKEFGSLVDADSVPNKAGEAYINLYHNEWRTNLVLPAEGTELNFRGFRGDYELAIIEGSTGNSYTYKFTVDEDTDVSCDITGDFSCN